MVELPELGSREIKTSSQDATEARVQKHTAGGKTNRHFEELRFLRLGHLGYFRSNEMDLLCPLCSVSQYFLFYPEKYTSMWANNEYV